MSASRHFSEASSPEQLKAEIKADIVSARGAQIDMQQAGQNRLAASMADAADEALDELNDVNNGTWRPKHA